MKLFGLYIIIAAVLIGCTKTKYDWTPVPDSVINKSNKNPASNKRTEDFTVKTKDGKSIAGSYIFLDGLRDSREPVVILIHQFNQTKEQWKADFVDSILVMHYKVIAYDMRGHGKSDKQDGDLSVLLTDPEQAPKDLEAIVNWAKTQKGIDSTKIAAIGTSIGGNVAIYGKQKLAIKVGISISNGKKTFESFTGYDERIMGRSFYPRMNNLLFISGSKDGDHQAGQKWMIDNFVVEPKELKVFDSDKHGMELIEELPEIRTIMLNWLKKYL
ncbi:MAG: alpha/beta fold hydrolase [Ignavibacteria bacterium]|nr:alpha/beta fold hydrolase [Ignavibacteria bacterium]